MSISVTDQRQRPRRAITPLRHSLLVQLMAFVVVETVIAAVVLLAISKDIPADAVVGLLGTALGSAGTHAIQRGGGRAGDPEEI